LNILKGCSWPQYFDGLPAVNHSASRPGPAWPGLGCPITCHSKPAGFSGWAQATPRPGLSRQGPPLAGPEIFGPGSVRGKIGRAGPIAITVVTKEARTIYHSDVFDPFFLFDLNSSFYANFWISHIIYFTRRPENLSQHGCG
jgi:hypothetical protein